MAEALITGIGVTSAIGQGQAAFADALFRGHSVFGVLARRGRQWPEGLSAGQPPAPVIGAEIGNLDNPPAVPRKALRTASWSAQVAVATLHEAWHDAQLDGLAPERIGLIVGGSNFQQRQLVVAQQDHAAQPWFLKPSYGHAFMDTDLAALCSEVFGIRGLACTLGAASASGQVAVLQAVEAVRGGRVDACIALGALMDLSFWELQAFRAMGAMGSDRHAAHPGQACRPFDESRDGFIYGEACAAVVVERADRRARPGTQPYAACVAGATAVDGHRGPDPSLEGEMGVVQEVLHRAGWRAGDVDYVNPHGSASRVGDQTELEALRRCGLGGAQINATKSLTGHGLSAAGAVEVVATLLQMRAGRLHPTLNLDAPIDPSWAWVRGEAKSHAVRRALTLSIGFGGINSALCLQC